MTNKLFENACNRISQPCPPIWMMRQAGRYQKGYMAMKEHYTFEQMCKRVFEQMCKNVFEQMCKHVFEQMCKHVFYMWEHVQPMFNVQDVYI